MMTIGTASSSNSSVGEKKMMDKIGVVVRGRPLRTSMETDSDRILHIDEQKSQVVVGFEKSYTFDRAFDNVSQERLYESCVRSLIDCFVTGNNVTVLAYGQTGAGKTYTMGTSSNLLDDESKGIIPRAIEDVFRKLTVQEAKVSFYEIYNEQVFDLLNNSKIKVPLNIKEDGNRFVIPNLTSCTGSRSEVLSLLERGCEVRSSGSTAQNIESSRSHAIFTLTIKNIGDEQGNNEFRLNLVDLAGSESFKRIQARGQTLAEGVNINKSLLALGNVIEALYSKKPHIPYRDSALTKILRESLQNGGYTMMIACVSPTVQDLNDTINTLRYADRTKHIKKYPLPPNIKDPLLSERKRKLISRIPPTPAKWRKNNRNNTFTTGTPTPIKKTPFRLNSTVTTPINNPIATRLVSTVCKMPKLDTISDSSEELDISGISSIPPPSLPPPPLSVNSTVVNDFSPLLRRYKEDIEESFMNQVQPLMSELQQLRKDLQEEKRQRKKIVSPKNLASPSKRALGDLTNVIGVSVSRILTPPNASENNQPQKGKETPLSVMEKTLGLNPDSPLLFDSPKALKSSPPAGRPMTRSSRRTTMMGSELNQTLKEIRNSAGPIRRRSVRIASAHFKHPLEVKENWKVRNQAIHNENILKLLNSGNLKLLQAIPAIGPKSAMIIHSYRDLHGEYESIRSLENIPGLAKHFFKKFITANQVVL